MIFKYSANVLRRMKMQYSPIVHPRPKASAMDAMAVPPPPPYSCSPCLLGPRDTAAPPTSQQVCPCLPKQVKYRHRNPFFVVQVLSSSSTGELFRFQPIRRKIRRTRRTLPRACRAKRFGPRTQLRRSSSNCPKQVREAKVRPNKNELSSSNFFQVLRTP